MRIGKNGIGSLKVINQARKDVVPNLSQTGKNTAGGTFGYYSQNDLLPLDNYCNDEGYVLLFSTDVSHLEARYEQVKTAEKKLTTYCGCKATLRIQSCESIDDWVEVDSYGFKVSMSGDKALGASTIARRYAYFQMFNINTTENDPDGPDDIRYKLNEKHAVKTSLLGSPAQKKKSLL